MKKILVYILALMTVLALATGCSGDKDDGKGTSTPSGSAADAGTTEPAGTTAEGTQQPDESSAVTSTAPVDTEPKPTIPPFDKTQPWDGKSACFDWYVNGDYRTGYRIADAYDLYGLTLLNLALDTGKSFYYDANYMLVLDTNGDGEVSDEVGYDANQLLGGDKFDGCSVFLENDIDLNGQHFIPLGSSGSFRGFFEGQDHTVKNFVVEGADGMHQTQPQSFYGFFAGLSNGAEVKDLTVSDATFIINPPEGHNDGVYMGMFGCSFGDVLVSNCHAYDITVRFDAPGKSFTLLGYALGRVDSVNAVLEGCTVYNFKIEGSLEGVDSANEWVGFDKTGMFVPTDCKVLTTDPRT